MGHKERLTTKELSPYAQILADVFIQRWDMYPRQLGGHRGYVAIHKPLYLNHLITHLQGKITLGAYILNEDSEGRFLVLDADDAPDWRRLKALAAFLNDLECPSYLENSRRGGHLWFFFDTWLSAPNIRRFGQGLLDYFHITDMELYPKQDQLQDGPGSLIRLPFGIHRRDGRRYGFHDLADRPLAPTLREQIQALSAPQTVPKQIFTQFMEHVPPPVEKPEFVPVHAVGDTPSEKIKAAVSVHDFVNRYVELSPTGRGLCPFHDDKVHSFGVHTEKNYWSCFAGCGGGSVIDFYIRYQQQVLNRPCDFKMAVAELSEMLLL